MGRVRSSFPRSRLPLHRRPFADPAAFRRWLLVAVLAASTAALTGRVLSTAEVTRARWGRTRTVLVVDRRLAVGEPLAGAVTPARWPAALVPPAALQVLPPGARAAGPVTAGTPATSALVATGLDTAGRRRLAVPLGAARLPLRRGHRVDVWATVDPSISGSPLTTRRVATGGVVTAVGTRSVVVAVRPEEVREVAEASALATVTLVATGP